MACSPRGCRSPWQTRALLRFLSLGLFLHNASAVAVSAANNNTSRLSSNNPHSFHTNQSAAQQQHRRLSDALACDLQLYHNFINSDEGADIFIMATLCESRIKYLKEARAGKFGPVEQSDLRTAMCSTECLASDALHNLAMATSRCSCAQVSANTCITHDFCLENSARLLCTHLSECGHWGCELEDFMCLRNEWDRHYTCGALSLKHRLLGIALMASVLAMVL